MYKPSLDWQSQEVVNVYDDLSLWTSFFAHPLLLNVPMQDGWTVVDLGCGTGFPLIELAQRMGSRSKLIGIDLWEEALIRLDEKKRILGLSNVETIRLDAQRISFAPNSIDLFVSNVGINNFENKNLVIEKSFQQLKAGGHFCLTCNDQNTFTEIYRLFLEVFQQLKLDADRMAEHINSRQNIDQLIQEFHRIGYTLEKQIQEETNFRFATAEAIFNHGFIRIAFISQWKTIVPTDMWDSFMKAVSNAIDARIATEGEFTLHVPVHYLHFKKPN